VIYIDVHEHIQHDQAELARAVSRLSTSGWIVVLSPAFPFLYSAFDAAISHFRRYTQPMLRAISPAGVVEEVSFYLDSVSLIASAANCAILRQSLPTFGQVRTWDRFMVPLSHFLDPLIGNAFGRSVVIVWKKA